MGLFGQNMKKLKILKLSRDSRYLQKLALKNVWSRPTQNDTRTFDFIFWQNKVRSLLWSAFYLWFLYRFGDFSFYFGRICQEGKKNAKGLVFDFINLI